MKQKVYCKYCKYADWSTHMKYLKSFLGCGYKKRKVTIRDPYEFFEVEERSIDFLKQNRNNNCKYYEAKCN